MTLCYSDAKIRYSRFLFMLFYEDFNIELPKNCLELQTDLVIILPDESYYSHKCLFNDIKAPKSDENVMTDAAFFSEIDNYPKKQEDNEKIAKYAVEHQRFAGCPSVLFQYPLKC